VVSASRVVELEMATVIASAPPTASPTKVLHKMMKDKKYTYVDIHMYIVLSYLIIYTLTGEIS
jgi:hypothetical protein